ncbi:MAG: DUF1177 domain-containing protein [Bacillota bacterium]
MVLNQVLEIVDLLDGAWVDAHRVRSFFEERGLKMVSVERVEGEGGATEFIQLRIYGSSGRGRGGDAPTLGVIGRLGGVGARPSEIGLVSDADGAICALSAALKILALQRFGDFLPGDLIIATHICPDAPIIPHDPVPFMGSPVDMQTMNEREVHGDMDAVLTIDTTKGNRIINHNGFAVTPTVKEGCILPPAPDLLEIMQRTTGRPASVLPLSQQDITPYGNGLDHINSLMQPATATDCPVVGVAITSQTVIPGSATGASREVDIAAAAQFVVEVAKQFTRGRCHFFSPEAYGRLVDLYGSMKRFQTMQGTD